MKNILETLEKGLEIYETLSNLPHNAQELKKAKKIEYLEAELKKYEAFRSGDLNLAGQVLKGVAMWQGYKPATKHYNRTGHIIELKRELALRKKRAEQYKRDLDIQESVGALEKLADFIFDPFGIEKESRKGLTEKPKTSNKKKKRKHKKKDGFSFSDFM